jgi:hypothetical protein
LDYIENTYIKCGDKNHWFSGNWSLYERSREGIIITTNIVEGWNRGLNSSFENNHSSLNVFVNEIRSRDFLISEDI